MTALRKVALVAGLGAVVLLAACSDDGPAVTGDVTKLDRSALPHNAVVTVELRDV